MLGLNFGPSLWPPVSSIKRLRVLYDDPVRPIMNRNILYDPFFCLQQEEAVDSSSSPEWTWTSAQSLSFYIFRAKFLLSATPAHLSLIITVECAGVQIILISPLYKVQIVSKHLPIKPFVRRNSRALYWNLSLQNIDFFGGKFR